MLTTMRCEMVSFPALKVIREKQRDVVGLVVWSGREREGGGLNHIRNGLVSVVGVLACRACLVLQQQMPAWCRWLFPRSPPHLFGQRAKASGGTALAGGVIECGWDKQSFSSRIGMGGGWSQNGVLPFDNGVLAWHNWYATLDRSRQAWQHFAPASQLAGAILAFFSTHLLKSQVLDAFPQ